MLMKGFLVRLVKVLLLIIVTYFLASYLFHRYQVNTGLAFIHLRDLHDDAQDVRKLALGFGILSTILSVLIPVGLYFLLLFWWKPLTKLRFIIRHAFWPLIILSSHLAAPFLSGLYNLEGSYVMSPKAAISGVILLSVIGAIIGIFIGWLRSLKKFSTNKI